MMKISCLTVTQFNRIDLLRRSIWSYSVQTTDPGHRELIIVHHEGTAFSKAIKELLSEFEIRASVIETDVQPLGALRNISVDAAGGDILCQWDDDDFYHPDRLLMQSGPFQNDNIIATTLASQMFWFINSHDLYIRNGAKEGIHGSIMFRKNTGLEYQPLAKGEDTLLINALTETLGQNVFCLVDHPELFVRTYHGLNTWDYSHHLKHTRQAFSSEWLLENELKIRAWLKILQIPPVRVKDNNNNTIFETI